jgi:hypothetical protein
MIRVEIIANHSVEENILEALKDEGVGKYYSKYTNVFGVGSSGPRMGDAIWPEENFALVVWCEEEEAQGIERATATVKKRFPDEGIKLFKLTGTANSAAEQTGNSASASSAAASAPPKLVSEAPDRDIGGNNL